MENAAAHLVLHGGHCQLLQMGGVRHADQVIRFLAPNCLPLFLRAIVSTQQRDLCYLVCVNVQSTRLQHARVCVAGESVSAGE